MALSKIPRLQKHLGNCSPEVACQLARGTGQRFKGFTSVDKAIRVLALNFTSSEHQINEPTLDKNHEEVKLCLLVSLTPFSPFLSLELSQWGKF